MFLSDVDIMNELKLKNIIIRPIGAETIRENGVDLTIGNEIIYDREPNSTILRDKYFYLSPKTACLIKCGEYIEIPDNMVGFCNLRSTWARKFCFIPPTVIDAGYKGNLTIELTNNSKEDLEIAVGTRFLHVLFAYLKTPTSKPYEGKYQGITNVQSSKEDTGTIRGDKKN